MTESVFYNLASSEGVAAIARLRELGHRVGLHAVYPTRRARRAASTPSSPGTTPTPAYMTAPIPGAVNVMQERVLRPADATARTRTSAGAPAARTRSSRAGAFPWLQLLVHPEIWVYPGSTMGQTMRAMLDAERERRSRSSPSDGSTC